MQNPENQWFPGFFHTRNSMAILIAMEVFLVLITAGAGVIEAVLEMASDSLGGFMRS